MAKLREHSFEGAGSIFEPASVMGSELTHQAWSRLFDHAEIARRIELSGLEKATP